MFGRHCRPQADDINRTEWRNQKLEIVENTTQKFPTKSKNEFRGRRILYQEYSEPDEEWGLGRLKVGWSV